MNDGMRDLECLNYPTNKASKKVPLIVLYFREISIYQFHTLNNAHAWIMSTLISSCQRLALNHGGNLRAAWLCKEAADCTDEERADEEKKAGHPPGTNNDIDDGWGWYKFSVFFSVKWFPCLPLNKMQKPSEATP